MVYGVFFLRTWLLLISLKFVIADRIPKIAYLTILDGYLLYSYFFMVILVIHACAQKQLKELVHRWESIVSHDCADLSWGCLEVYHFNALYWIENLTEFYVMLFFLFVWSLGHAVLGYIFCYDLYKDYFVYIDYFSFLWAPYTLRKRALAARVAKARMGDTVDDVMMRNRSKKEGINEQS
jgi:hypothetical protein